MSDYIEFWLARYVADIIAGVGVLLASFAIACVIVALMKVWEWFVD